MKSTVLCVLLTMSVACVSSGTPEKQTTGSSSAAEPAPQQAPLGFIVGRSVLILPVQRNVIYPDSSWRMEMTKGLAFPQALDDAIESALKSRGLGATWTFAPAISAMARRNAGLIPDPHVLAVGNLTRLTKAGDDALPQALGSQIRELVAMREGRYALLPTAVRFSRNAAGERATLVLYLIDSRTARIAWSGQVNSDPAASITGAMAASIGDRVAELVVGR
ncbi:MAG TPA: hypothetical protein VM099_15075 [Gemmatimonadaceae bacterium]|nr:hypothetical protein [Gemmatimonadaceae bacterium]